MDKLGSYKLNKAFTKGVDIRLDDAPDVCFLIRLPSQYNRAYSQALYGAMDWSIGDDGQVTTGGNLLATRYAQEDSFIQHCLISMDGEPIPDDFPIEYPQALAELMSKATDLTNDLESNVKESVKKSPASSTGKGSGQGAKNSMPSLSSAAG